jgi:hypothetical protein
MITATKPNSGSNRFVIKSRKLKSANKNKLPMTPPPLTQQRRITQTIRYQSTGSTNVVVTRRCLLNWKLSMFTNASSVMTAAVLSDSVKVKRINLWATSDDSQNNLCFTWLSQNSPQNLLTDSGNVMRPAKLTTKPPKDSYCDQWVNSTDPYLNNGIFSLTCPSNTIIDVTFLFVIQDWVELAYSGKMPASVPAPSTFEVYTPPLDNVTVTNTVGPATIVPIFMNGAGGSP